MNSAILSSLMIQTALEAGELLARGFGTSFHTESKQEGRQNLVTEYDKAAENLILRRLVKAFPKSCYLAEESGASTFNENEILWIVDPLDGTVNFAHNIPFFSVSIAAFFHGEVLAGVVYHPLLKELFVAEKGKGATLNGAPIHVSEKTTSDKAVLSTGFPYNTEANPLGCIEALSRILHLGFPIRRLGSAALDLCYLAAGRVDGYWEVTLEPWDMAAGSLIVEESGGKVTNYLSQKIDVRKKSSLLATNGPLHPIILNSIYPS